MTDPKTHKTQQTRDEHAASRSDTQSDPSLDDGESTDWSSEGGATPEGPATAPADR